MPKNPSQEKGRKFEELIARMESMSDLPIPVQVRRTGSAERWKSRTGDINCFHSPHRCVFCDEHQELKQHQNMSLKELETHWSKTKDDAGWKIPVLVIKLNDRFQKDILVVKRLEDYLKEKVELEGYRQKQ